MPPNIGALGSGSTFSRPDLRKLTGGPSGNLAKCVTAAAASGGRASPRKARVVANIRRGLLPSHKVSQRGLLRSVGTAALPCRAVSAKSLLPPYLPPSLFTPLGPLRSASLPALPRPLHPSFPSGHGPVAPTAAGVASGPRGLRFAADSGNPWRARAVPPGSPPKGLRSVHETGWALRRRFGQVGGWSFACVLPSSVLNPPSQRPPSKLS